MTGELSGPAILLVGPYDPYSGEYTFLAPPLGVWRLKGVLHSRGFEASVFDPNCVESGTPEQALEVMLSERPWDAIGFSTTGMTLKWDLALAHLAHRLRPEAIFIAGGMEATFNPQAMFDLGPFDLLVLGEGERPLLELLQRMRDHRPLEGILGTAWPSADGSLQMLNQPAMTHDELRDAIFAIPYEEMPYERYWKRLEKAYRIGALPFKADREARLAEIRSVRLITLNYCPMGCTFCSSTNFLNAAQGGTARIARLDAGECVTMIQRIVAVQPRVRTIIFQDDIFVFRTDPRILPLMQAIIAAKQRGDLPQSLQFISTNRIDAMSRERMEAMKAAGFRVLGFGIESFSLPVLREFNKGAIHEHIVPALQAAREIGITPFLDVILTSPHCTLSDLSESIRQAFRWIGAGCEVGMYPYVIPFSGAAMSTDPRLEPQTVFTMQHVPGTAVSWQQPSKILPFDAVVREAIVEIEQLFEARLGILEREVAHLPSRVRSLLWIASSIPILAALGEPMPSEEEAIDQLIAHLPGLPPQQQEAVREQFGGAALARATG